jgi:formylglycine-generating enzyme required for sulfatase activity
MTMALVISACPTPDTDTEPGKKAPQITAFKITVPFEAVGVIDQSARTITITVPASTPAADFAAVLAEITHNGTAISHNGAEIDVDIETFDFSSPQEITVSGPDGSTTYTVTIKYELVLTRFAIVDPVLAEGIIDETGKTIIVSYDSTQITTDQITALKAEVAHNGTDAATVTPDPAEVRDYSSPVAFTLQDGGVSKTYTVVVQRADLSALGISAFTLHFDSLISSTGVIDEPTQTIVVPRPANLLPAVFTALIADVTYTGASIEPNPAEAQDYSSLSKQFVLRDTNGNPKPYTVVLEAAQPNALVITTNPTKMLYNIAGEAIDLAGIVVALQDTAGGITPVDAADYTIEPDKIPETLTGFDNTVPVVFTHTATSLTATLDLRAKIIPLPDKKEFTVGTITFNMNKVNAGSFLRQLTSADPDPADVTTITNAYRMGEFEVTAELLHEVLGKVKEAGVWVADTSYTTTISSQMGSGKNAAGKMSFFAAIAFCNKLSARLDLTPVYTVSTVSDWAELKWSDIPCEVTSGSSSIPLDANWNALTWDREADGFRLPTEMEFVWAAIGADALNPMQQTEPGDITELWAGKELGLTLIECSNYSGQGGHGVVGRKAANVLGIYDLNGSVGEIVWDRGPAIGNAGSGDPHYQRNQWPSGQLTDYVSSHTGNERMVKGGSGSQAASPNSNLYFCDAVNPPGYGRWSGNGFRVAINEPAD